MIELPDLAAEEEAIEVQAAIERQAGKEGIAAVDWLVPGLFKILSLIINRN